MVHIDHWEARPTTPQIGQVCAYVITHRFRYWERIYLEKPVDKHSVSPLFEAAINFP